MVFGHIDLPERFQWDGSVHLRVFVCVCMCECFDAVPCLEPEGRWEGFHTIWCSVKLSEPVSAFGDSYDLTRGVS